MSVFILAFRGTFMPIFSCSDCGLAFTAPDDRRDEDVVCPGCKKKQRPPADTRNIVIRQPPPDYLFSAIVAGTFMIISVVAVIFGTLMAMERGIEGIYVIASGLMFLAISMILNFARIIARQTHRKIDD
jgi:hypothetical protein